MCSNCNGDEYREAIEVRPAKRCEHDVKLRWRAERGEFECCLCGETVDCPELREALAPDLGKSYDLQVCL